MSKCNLSNLPVGAFTTTPNIGQLLLNDNNLKNDEEGSMKFLETLTRLEQLDLSFNNITAINRSKFGYSYQLMSLRLVGNPWKCDCYVVDMWRWGVMSEGYIDVLEDSKRLECNFDPKSSPINKAKLTRPGSELITWARYVGEANCPLRGQ